MWYARFVSSWNLLLRKQRCDPTSLYSRVPTMKTTTSMLAVINHVVGVRDLSNLERDYALFDGTHVIADISSDEICPNVQVGPNDELLCVNLQTMTR
jgi:hypothetical protein